MKAITRRAHHTHWTVHWQRTKVRVIDDSSSILSSHKKYHLVIVTPSLSAQNFARALLISVHAKLGANNKIWLYTYPSCLNNTLIQSIVLQRRRTLRSKHFTATTKRSEWKMFIQNNKNFRFATAMCWTSDGKNYTHRVSVGFNQILFSESSAFQLSWPNEYVCVGKHR